MILYNESVCFISSLELDTLTCKSSNEIIRFSLKTLRSLEGYDEKKIITLNLRGYYQKDNSTREKIDFIIFEFFQ